MADTEVCNHILGYHNGAILLDDLDRFFAYQIQCHNLIHYYYYHGKTSYIKDSKEFWRNNRGMFFNYCPSCGVKIDWIKLLNINPNIRGGGLVKDLKERLEYEQ